MNLPRNIDLTENGDFGWGRNRLRPLTIIDGEAFLRIMNMEESISLDDYELICEMESIFGKKPNDISHEKVDKIFGIESPEETEMTTHCLRCGVELRIPWESKGGLCKICNEGLEDYRRGIGIVPWEPIKRTGHRNNGAMEIFDLR